MDYPKPSLHCFLKSAKMLQNEIQLLMSTDLLNNAHCREILQVLEMEMGKRMRRRNGDSHKIMANYLRWSDQKINKF